MELMAKGLCIDYRSHRARWRVPCRIPAQQGLCRSYPEEALVLVQHTGRVDHLYQDPHEQELGFTMHYGDMTDATNLIRVVQETQPDEIYNLAAQSHVQVSFETPEYTANADGLGTLRLLEAIRLLNLTAKTRFYQASTSELFGKVAEV